jgi:hypothetical protein
MVTCFSGAVRSQLSELPPRLSRARPRVVPIQLLAIVHSVIVLLALRDPSPLL